jgi:hypothetical protein
LKKYKYINKENAFAIETDGKSIFVITLLPNKTETYSKDYPKIIKGLFLQLDEFFDRKRKSFDIDFTIRNI